MRIAFLPLGQDCLDLAVQLIKEAAEFSPQSQALFSPLDILASPRSHWFTAHLENEIIGIVGFHNISWPDGTAEVALGIMPHLRGQGLGKELAQAQNTFAFTELGLRKLQMTALTDSPSCKIAKAAGLTLEGTLRGCRLKRGTYHDASVYALVKEG